MKYLCFLLGFFIYFCDARAQQANVPSRSPAIMVVNPIAVPQGWGVQDIGLNGSGYYPFDIATSAAANWGIVAYANAPNESYLMPFTTTTSGTVTEYSTVSSTTAAQGMALTFSKDSSTGNGIQTLTQSGVTTGALCSNNTEIDLFLFPNGNAPPNQDPAYPTAYLASAPKPTLDLLSGIMVSGSVTLQSQSSSTGSAAAPCEINQGAMIYSLTLNNATTSQTLFYQIAFNYFCYPGNNATFNAYCSATIPSMNYFFTGSGGVWGIDDPINNYTNTATGVAYTLISTNVPVSVAINILPRLAYLIENGQYGLDTTLSHWSIGSFYYGQHTWGSASLASTWSSTNFGPSILIQP